MFCFPEADETYISYLQPASPPTPTPTPTTPPHTINDYILAPMTDAQFYFAHFSMYILFPLLYSIIATGNYKAVMTLWSFIQSGIFDIVSEVKDVVTDIVYGALRVFGQYSFSTYTVVKNGREIYTASSMYFFYHTDVNSVYKIDRAKYNVCKWIDKQCALYKRQYNGDEAELTDTHNDIYDFILHKVDDEPYTRIHRGDFSARTHTLSINHYRKFAKSYQIADKAEITVCPSVAADADADADADAAPERFTINLKTPHHFFLEKNEFLDKSFLQWKLYNECGRKDVANYIGMPFSNYKVTMFYNECMKASVPNVVFQLNDSHSVLIGSRYLVKVDSVLRCPVLESGEHPVFDIDTTLSSYYSDTASEITDSESSESSESDADAEADADTEAKDADSESDTDTESKAEATEATDASKVDDPEFEIIEGETPTQ